MALSDFWKKRKQSSGSPTEATPPPASGKVSPASDRYEIIRKLMSQRSPSDQFASGAVFDFVRQNQALFNNIVRSKDMLKLQEFFVNSFMTFYFHPEAVGLNAQLVNQDNLDTDPRRWNMDAYRLSNGGAVALCFMPINSDTLDARVVGIIIDSKPLDGYYYCMLNKGADTYSDVYRNMAWDGVRPAGRVKGRGFGLMNDFLKCIVGDYYQ